MAQQPFPVLVLWQFRMDHHNTWQDIDPSDSALMERAFANPAISNCSISHSMWNVQQTFHVDDMKLSVAGFASDFPVRRSKRGSAAVVEYWDDVAWVSYNPYDSCTIADAQSFGRNKTHIYPPVFAGGPSACTGGYDILLSDPSKPMQLNTITMNWRPMHISKNTPVEVLGDDDADDDADIADDPGMPSEYRCPITHMPMVTPVVAADGHSYEKVALQRWLLTKNKSPISGQKLKHTTMCINHNLRKLIRDWAPAEAGTSSQAPPPKKKMKRAHR